MRFLPIIFTAAITLSCTTVKADWLCRLEPDITADTPVYIADISLEPDHLLNSVSGILPEVVKSCLHEQGFNVLECKKDEALGLSVLIINSSYQNEYNTYESITLSFSLIKYDSIAGYCLYTCDTDSSLDSFALVLTVLEDCIGRLAEEVFNEK